MRRPDDPAAALYIEYCLAASCRRGGQAAKHASFNWVSTAIGNLKNSLRGTYHAIRPKPVPRYLAQFQYRFNRRYRLEEMIQGLARERPRHPAHAVPTSQTG